MIKSSFGYYCFGFVVGSVLTHIFVNKDRRKELELNISRLEYITDKYKNQQKNL